MANITTSPYGLLSAAIRAKLDRLRLALRLRMLAEGAAWLILAVSAAVALTFLCDWGLSRLTLQPVERAQRAVVLGFCLAVLLAVLWRKLLWRMTLPMPPAELALLVEKHYPQLQDRLISAVQIGDDPSFSREMVRRLAQQANDMSAGLDFRAPVRWRIAVAAWALLAMMALAAWAALAPATAALWFQRDVLLADVDWPLDTVLTLPEGREYRVVRGGDLTVTVLVDPRSRRHPRQAVFHMRYGSVGRVEQIVQAESISSKSEVGSRKSETRSPQEGSSDFPLPTSHFEGVAFRQTFQQVSEPFDFWVTANDGRTADCHVSVIEPPEVLAVQFTIEYPGYMNLPSRTIEGTRGVLPIPPGAWVTFQARASKDLSAARALVDGQEACRARIVDQDVGWVKPEQREGADPPVNETRSCEAAVPHATGVAGRFQFLPRDADQPTASLRLELTDTGGLTNAGSVSYLIQVVRDQKPSLQVLWTALGGSLTPQAYVPMEIDARDDYGLAELAAVLRVKQPATAPATAAAASQSAGQPPPAGERLLAIGQYRPAERRVAAPFSADLAALELAAGEVVSLAVRGSDDQPGEPNVAETEPREFKIVTEQELMGELLKRQKEMRVRMDQVMEAQATARDRARSAGEQMGTGGAEVESRRLLAESSRSQQTVATFTASIAETYSQILTILTCNRAGQESDRQRLQQRIIQPLTDLLAGAVPAVQAGLDSAGKLTDASALAGEAARLAADQQKLYERLDAVRMEMAQLESMQELARVLTNIISVSQDVKKGIGERLKTRTGGLFDPGSATRPATMERP